MPAVVFSRGMRMCMINPSALVNVCIWFVSRAHRWASKPLREVVSFSSSLGWFVEVFIFARRRTCFLELVRRRLKPASVGRV